MAKLTIAILTCNEKINIKDVIANALKCTDDVLIIDSGSTDDTVKVAKKVGARVIYRAWDNDFAAQRNFALENTDAEWILYLDADERLNDVLIAKVKAIVASDEVDKQYSIKRKSGAFGQEFNYGVLHPDFVFRMFPTKKVHWVNKVHERPICDLNKEVLPGYIKHYTYRNWEHYEKKINQYTTIWAEDAYKNGKRTSLGNALVHSIVGFIKMFLLKKGFMDGTLGSILCFYYFFYTLRKYVKLYDLQRLAKKDNK